MYSISRKNNKKSNDTSTTGLNGPIWTRLDYAGLQEIGGDCEWYHKDWLRWLLFNSIIVAISFAHQMKKIYNFRPDIFNLSIYTVI